MDPQTLKDEYGRDLVFWGGGVDTQFTSAASGSPEGVSNKRSGNESTSWAGTADLSFLTIHNIVD